MKYFFHSNAEKELEESIDYYENCQKGLGVEFAEEVYATISRIINYPYAWTKLTENTRRCLTNRFPFGVIYQLKNNKIHIIAIANLNRRPKYWQGRY